MTRWLLILWLVWGPSPAFAQENLAAVPPCRGIERGYVTMNIAPNGAVLYYLSDRPIVSVANVKNLTCSFPITRKVQLIEELPL